MAHIVRVKGKSTVAWQVRVGIGSGRKYHSKMFSDSVFGGSDDALVAAKKYLDDFLSDNPEYRIPQRKPQGPYHEGLHPNNVSGINGVHREGGRIVKWRGKSKVKHPQWRANYTVNGKGLKKSFSTFKYGEEEAKRLAIEFRKMWEEAADKGKQAVIDFIENHKNGYLE